MKLKEVTKSYMMISNLKKPLVSMIYTKVFQRFNGVNSFMLKMENPRVTFKEIRVVGEGGA